MKHWMIAGALICFGSLARAVGPTPSMILPQYRTEGAFLLAQGPAPADPQAAQAAAPAPAAPVAQPSAFGTAPSVTNSPSYLYNIGRGFGPNASYHVAFDYNPMVGACVGRDWTDGKFLGGPCHNALVGTRNNVPVIVTGFAILYDADHLHPDYQFMAGGNLFGLGAVISNDVLRLGIKAPPWLQKFGECAYFYYGLGHRLNYDPNDVKTPQTVTVMLTYKFGSLSAADAAAQAILKGGL